MQGDADLAAIGALIADRTRATFLLTLMGGGPLAASALAERAGVSRSLASAHLRKLVEGGLLRVRPSGRQRLYELDGQPVAHALEALVLLAPPARVSSLRGALDGARLRFARLCFDHLAGTVGVGLTEAMVAQGHLVPDDGAYAVTAPGRALLGDLGVDAEALAHGRRPLTRACLDWSERRHHLAGAVGHALAQRLMADGWIEPREGSRIVTVTAAGRSGLAERFGLRLEPAATPSPTPTKEHA